MAYNLLNSVLFGSNTFIKCVSKDRNMSLVSC